MVIAIDIQVKTTDMNIRVFMIYVHRFFKSQCALKSKVLSEPCISADN